MFHDAWMICFQLSASSILTSLLPLEYLSHLLISIAECLEGRLNSSPNMWNLFDVFDSLMQKIWSTRISQQRNKNTHWDGEIHQLGTRIRSPYCRPQFKSARNLANLHKQSARRARSPSSYSFLSSAWSGPSRDVVPVWLKRQQTIMLIRRRIVLCNAFLVGLRSCVKKIQNWLPYVCGTLFVCSLDYQKSILFLIHK